MEESLKNQSTNLLTESLSELYLEQMENQKIMIKNGMYDQYIDWVTKNQRDLPIDHPQLASYHIQQLISEIGEVLEVDKRWKNFRNAKYSKNDKLEELADCFIVLMNIVMFSGFSSTELYNAIYSKIEVVNKRIKEEKI
jgi:NTP pyrophosphatase (non-canonical NTP hydrolase)